MEINILERIFSSKVRPRVILTIFSENRPLYESEISLLSKVKRTSVQAELKNLLKMGFLNVTKTSTKTFYSVNKKFVFYNEIKKMINKR